MADREITSGHDFYPFKIGKYIEVKKESGYWGIYCGKSPDKLELVSKLVLQHKAALGNPEFSVWYYENKEDGIVVMTRAKDANKKVFIGVHEKSKQEDLSTMQGTWGAEEMS